MLRSRLTEVRETFTRGGPWVWIEKLLLGFFPGPPYTIGWAKSDEIWHIFRPRPQTFCSHARTRQNIVILKKNLLSTDGCQVCQVWWTLAYKPLRSTRHIIVFFSKFGSPHTLKFLKLMTWVNSLGHVLFPFARWQHDHAQTPLPCETSMIREQSPCYALPIILFFYY